jgi:hypothetical protein
MVLQENLKGTMMTKRDSITSFLMIFAHIHDELEVVGEIVYPSKFVRKTLNGFLKPW